jgi:hypothetical protein
MNLISESIKINRALWILNPVKPPGIGEAEETQVALVLARAKRAAKPRCAEPWCPGPTGGEDDPSMIDDLWYHHQWLYYIYIYDNII